MPEYRSIQGEIKLLENKNDFLFPIEIWMLNDKVNRNNWKFVNLAEHKDQWAGVPILVAYVNGGRTAGDGHNQTTRYDKNGEAYQSFTDATAERICGSLSDDADDIRLEERDGALWTVGRGTLWAWYSHELCTQIADWAEQGQTMSVSIEALVTDSYMDGDVEVETSYIPLGVTLLGAGVAPAVPDAHIAMLSEIKDEFNELKLRAASYLEHSDAEAKPQNNPNDKGVKQHMRLSKQQVRELQPKFADHTVLAAEQKENGNVVVCLMSAAGQTAVYVMAALDESIVPERIISMNAQVHFCADGEEDVCVDACEITEASANAAASAENRAECAEKELAAAKDTIAKMEAAENARRLAAAKSVATATLDAFNANREDKVDVKVLEALTKDIEAGKFTACADENGAWTGDAMVAKEVKALCADAVMELDKAAAKRSEQRQMTWGSVKQASAAPGTIGELFASKN